MRRARASIISLLRGNKAVLTLLFLLGFGACYIVLKGVVFEPALSRLAYTNNNNYVLALNIPANLDFCGEKIPSNDYDIRAELDREFFNDDYWKSNSMVLFNRARRWFPYIEPILAKEGVPDDFKYLAVIESHLSNVTSPAAASGFWQLVAPTAINFGLEVTEEVDERLDVEKSTRAACRHILQSYDLFKNWTLAAAAYNRGIGGIQQAMKKQGASSYYELALNRETGSFVYRILAYKTLLSSPAHFGIRRKKLSNFPKPQMKVFRVDTSIASLSAFAQQAGCDYVTMKQLNPWLRRNSLSNPARKTYEIRVPKGGADLSGYINDLNPSAIPYSGTQVRPLAAAQDSLKPSGVKTINYVVHIDEPLEKLADFLKVNVNDLRKWNNLDERATAVKNQTLIIHYPLK